MSWLQAGVLDPQGPIAKSQLTIIGNATTIMLAVVIPVIVMTLVFAWWFRAGNTRAVHWPDWSYSGRIELVVWSIPTLVVVFLGGIAWLSSHDLDPRRQIASNAKPLQVQVVALDWKWLFIYPEQGVASVNQLAVPAGVPIRFQLTSATVMNSFFVPQLGSQIYAMAGMTTELNLLADRPGTYQGLSAQFSGNGFSDMRFTVEAMPQQGFDDWIAKAKQANAKLDAASYADLARPGSNVAVATFGQVDPAMFETALKASQTSADATPASPAAMPAHHGK